MSQQGLGRFNWSGWQSGAEYPLYDEFTQSQIPYDPNLDWQDLIGRGIDVIGAATSHSPYVSPDDPRYRPNVYNNYPQPYPQGANGARPRSDAAAVDVNRNGVTAQIPFWAWAVGGGLVVAFLFGKGRR